jgi:hypothetical protein
MNNAGVLLGGPGGSDSMLDVISVLMEGDWSWMMDVTAIDGYNVSKNGSLPADSTITVSGEVNPTMMVSGEVSLFWLVKSAVWSKLDLFRVIYTILNLPMCLNWQQANKGSSTVNNNSKRVFYNNKNSNSSSGGSVVVRACVSVVPNAGMIAACCDTG